MAQWLERGALPKSMPAVRFRIPFDAEFSEKYRGFPLSILGQCFDVVSLGTSPSNASFDAGENKDLVGKICQSGPGLKKTHAL